MYQQDKTVAEYRYKAIRISSQSKLVKFCLLEIEKCVRIPKCLWVISFHIQTYYKSYTIRSSFYNLHRIVTIFYKQVVKNDIEKNYIDKHKPHI